MFKHLPLIAVLLFPAVASAQQTTLNINGETLIVPALSGYSLVEDNGAPEYAAVFETAEIEPWEEIAEFNEELIIIGYGFASDDPAVIAERFTAMFNSLYTYALAEQAGTAFQLDTTLVNPDLFDDLASFSSASRASSITVSANSATQKALIFETGFVMPGVTTYPIVEEFSFTLVGDMMIVSRAQRVSVDVNAATFQLDPAITQDLRHTGAELREGLLAANAP